MSWWNKAEMPGIRILPRITSCGMWPWSEKDSFVGPASDVTKTSLFGWEGGGSSILIFLPPPLGDKAGWICNARAKNSIWTGKCHSITADDERGGALTQEAPAVIYTKQHKCRVSALSRTYRSAVVFPKVQSLIGFHPFSAFVRRRVTNHSGMSS